MNKILTNIDKYRSNIIRIRELMFVDRIIDPIQLGAFWTDKLLKSTSISNYTSLVGRHLSHFEYHNCDIMLMIVVGILMIFVV
jgi:hypothetical protein